jgi:enterochelin esterase family protein
LLCFDAAGKAQGPQPIISPEVAPDGRVTFRFKDPNAQKVTVSIEGQTGQSLMQKDESGLWSVTVGPFPPDF